MRAFDDRHSSNSLLQRAALVVALIVIGAAVYANSLTAPFIFDDIARITGDASIRDLGSLSQVLGNTRRPLVKLSLAINHAVGGENVVGYHLVNVSIHILAALALFGVVRRTLLTPRLRKRYERSASWLAFVTSLIWVVHPLTTQAVTYTIQRSESLMGLFYLLTVYAVIRSTQGERRCLWLVTAIITCALGMVSKEVMITAPLVVWLYDRTFLAGSWIGPFKERTGLYVGLAATWVLLFIVIGTEWVTKTETTAGFAMQTIKPVQYALSQTQLSCTIFV